MEGIISKILQQSYEQAQAAEMCKQRQGAAEDKRSGATTRATGKASDTIQKWVVLDGAMDSSWVEGLHTVLDDTKVLSLANRGHIKLHG